MSLFDTINEDIKKAMLAREKEKLEALRAVKSALLLVKTEKGGASELSEDAEIKLLQKLVKQRKESADIYKSQNRQDLYEKEISEAQIIEQYLPAQLSEEKLTDILKQIVEKVGAKEPKEMGKVMGMASKELAGKADGKLIATIVKKLLS